MSFGIESITKIYFRPMRLLIIPSLLLIFLAGFLLSCKPAVKATLEWPEITQESKPWSRWWQQGSSVTKAGLAAELEAYQKAGLGGLELTPIYGVIGEEDQFVDYLSPQWLDMLEFTLQEAEKLDLGLDMANGTGWPFGGPWVGEADACKYLAHKRYALTTGERLKEPIVFTQEPFVRAVTNQVYQLYGIYKEKGESPTGSQSQPELLADRKPLEISDLTEPVEENGNLQGLALDQVRFAKQLPLQSLTAYSNEGLVIDLLEKVDDNSLLNWTAPEGNWTIYAVFQGWHGKMVERAAPGGEGNVIDHFSTPAIQNYLARFDEAFTGRDLEGLRAFFNDSYEVDDARGQADWTPKLLEAFQKKQGYDLREHWPALFGEDTEEKNIRVLSDYRETFSDLILETFTKEWEAWAREKGKIVRNQAHGSPANILDLYAASEIPETEGEDILRIKFASSAAHVAGKNLASAEAATWLNEHFLSNLSDIKRNLDRYLVGGVNHIFYHGTCYSPPGEEWPGRLFYAAIHANPSNSLWHDFPALNRYVARAQSFLQAGKPDNDVLLYFPIYDRFARPGIEILEHFDGHGPGMEDSPFEEAANFLQEKGFGFDYISDRQIRLLNFKDRNLETGGANYQTILLPECRFIPLSTFEKLLELAQSGARIIVHKTLPGDVPGFGLLEERQAKFKALTDQFSFEEPARGVQEAKIGEGSFLLGEQLEPLLAYARLEREALVDRGLEYIRRTDEGEQYYFITNWSGEDLDGWIPLQTDAKAVGLFDPMTERTGFAKLRLSESGQTEVYLQLSQGAACILQTFRSQAKGTPWNYIQKTGASVDLDGSWKINFIKGGPEMPAPATINSLDSWTKLEGEAYKNFSGTARYSLTFQKPEEEGGVGWLLDLGEVRESARVYFNGKPLATLIGPVYQTFIDQNLFEESNTLEIEISNLMANRIADLDRRNVFWKKFYNINFPARRSENRAKNGLFDASAWTPTPSGLIGPVRLGEVVRSQ